MHGTAASITHGGPVQDKVANNLSGGLKSKSHPVGATGASMHALINKQLIARRSACRPGRQIKVADLLRALETYVSGRSALIIDYATSRRQELPISTAPTESMVQCAADAMVATRRPSAAQGPDLRDERHVRAGLRRRRVESQTSISPGRVTPQKLWTVSSPIYVS
jgi:hypothetical protein